MGVRNFILTVPLTTINSATIGGAYQPINVGGLLFACFALHITNASNADVIVSFNGTTDHEYIPAGKDIFINGQTNAQPQNNVAQFRQGMVVYVRGVAGVGFVTLAGYYQPNVR